MREWHEVHSQLRTLAGELGLRSNRQPAEYEAIHRSLLAGLLGNIAMKLEDGTYQGARNLRLAIFPGSGLARKGPKWIMAGQLVETSRLYAHLVARIDPAWVEPLAGARLKRSYSEPHWEKRPAQVAAWERVILYGLVIHPRRRVNYGPKVRALEHKSRRHDVLVDEETLFAFYHERIPEGIYSGARFERWRRWRKEAERENPRLLFLSREQLMRQDAAHISGERFPDHLSLEGVALPLHYHFEPGDAVDGVTLTVPVALLNQLSPERFEWLAVARPAQAGEEAFRAGSGLCPRLRGGAGAGGGGIGGGSFPPPAAHERGHGCAGAVRGSGVAVPPADELPRGGRGR